ncbi:hypothetical protein NSX47_24335, partial [Salmonella enterica]|nr:hypothetical protein [Salmonella enterica]
DEKKQLSAEEPNEGAERLEKTTEKNEMPPQMQKERKSDIEGKNQKEQQQTEEDSQEMSASDMETNDKEIKKQLNKEARQIMKETIHEKEGL